MPSQPVYFGVTQSGQQGLFTRGMLAWPLDDRGVYNFHADPKGFCERLGFAYTACRVCASFGTDGHEHTRRDDCLVR